MVRDGETRLRAALRRWGRALGGERARARPSGRRLARHGPVWWPRLNAAQVQGLLGAAVTLALALWEQVRQRWGQP